MAELHSLPPAILQEAATVGAAVAMEGTAKTLARDFAPLVDELLGGEQYPYEVRVDKSMSQFYPATAFFALPATDPRRGMLDVLAKDPQVLHAVRRSAKSGKMRDTDGGLQGVPMGERIPGIEEKLSKAYNQQRDIAARVIEGKLLAAQKLFASKNAKPKSEEEALSLQRAQHNNALAMVQLLISGLEMGHYTFDPLKAAMPKPGVPPVEKPATAR